MRESGVRRTGGGEGRTALAAWLLLALALAAPAVPRQRPPRRDLPEYRPYYNVRFKYAVSYPQGVLCPQGEADNADGQKFVSPHADAVLTVYGAYNVLNDILGGLYADASRGGLPADPKRVVTYRARGRDWFVVSGHDGGRVFYEKTTLRGDTIRSMSFVYPERRRSLYAPLAARISQSFRPLR